MTRPPSSPNDRAKAPQTFKDGLGTRERAADAGGDAIEHLHLCQEVAAQESAIRDRVGRLVNFRHARYVRLRGVDRAKGGTRALYVAYDALEGRRLSEVLAALPTLTLSIDVDVALQIIRDLLPAIGILHDSRKVTHGCIAPERLVYTAQQRLVIVDHGLGAALQRMNVPRKKLWDQFRIASPAPNKAVFDEKMDIVQIGLVALALMLGRPLTDEEYPGQIKRLIFSIKEQSSRIGSRPIGPELRRWLERATGVDEAQTFGSIKEAQDAFEGVVAVDRYAPTAAAVKAFFQRYEELTVKAAPVAPAAEERDARKPGASLDLDSALSELQMQVTIAPRRRQAASEPPPAAPAKPAAPAVADADARLSPPVAAQAVEFKLPGAKKAAKTEKAEPVAAEANGPVTFGRRKSDRLDALQTLQAEMGAAAGEDVSALEHAANAIYQDAASKSVVRDDGERVAREAAERARQEAEAREQAEREGRALAEQVARDAAEQVAREAADRAEAQRHARAASEREALERGARQEAERQAHEASLRATREAADREAAEQTARDATARVETEREARLRLERDAREAAERRSRELAERDAADATAKVRREQEAREREAEREAAEKTHRELTAREAAERRGREQAEKEARAAAERAAKEAADRAAAERAALEASARAEREAAERATVHKALLEAAERAERAEREAVERAARAEQEATERAERAAKEAADHLRRELAAREVAERQARELAEKEARAAAERAAKEAADRAAAEQAAREATARAERAERAAADREARSEREAAERAAKEAAERLAKEAAAREAAERQGREQAEKEARAAAERAAREATDRAAAERAARAAAERAERAEREAAAQAERAERVAAERAERAAQAAAERAAKEAAAREAAHVAAREAAERAVLEAAEREAAQRTALAAAEQAVKEAAQRAADERVAREAAEQLAREASQRALADLAAQHAGARGEFEAAGRVAAERAAREATEAAAAASAAREQAVREARAAGERAAKEAAEREAAERAARVHAAAAEAERQARTAAEREAERHAAERHAAVRAAREASTLIEAERQARAAAEARARESAEQAARETASREATEKAAKEAAEMAAAEKAAREAQGDGDTRRRRKGKKRFGVRTPEEVSAVEPQPSVAEAPAVAIAAPVPAPAQPWQLTVPVEAIPAWARGATAAPDGGAPVDAPAPPVAEAAAPVSAAPVVLAPMAESASASILPFQPPQADTWMHRGPQIAPSVAADVAADAESRAAVVPMRRARRFHINWARTLAAALLVALLEGVAFATAWWYVTPEQQGWLVVHTKPAGIQISVDGMVMGQTPYATALRPGRHTIELRYGTATRVVPVEISPGVQTEQTLNWGNGFTTGQASITSTPAGSKVLIDGRQMGSTPITVSDLLPGKHEVTVEGPNGSATAILLVEPGETTELDVPVYAGWASVLSPVKLDILLGGKLIGSTEIEKMMLAAGKHTLELENDSLGYKGSVEVRVRPGSTTSVSVVPKTKVTVEAPQGTELSVNGEAMGTLPNANLEVALGTAEFVLRYKDEERRLVMPVTMLSPVVVKYDAATTVEPEKTPEKPSIP